MMVKKYELNLIKAIQAIYFCFLPVSLLVMSYLRVDTLSSLYFKANDGWCNSMQEGLGIHCFGDFNQGFVNYNESRTPKFQNHIWLGPLDGVISRISSYSTILLSQRVVLFLVILIYLTLLLLPVIDIRRNQPSNISIWWVTLFYVGSVPFLATIDRLNSIILAVPLCYFFFCAMMKQGKNPSIILFLGMCVVKPQLAVLALVVWKVKGLQAACAHLFVAFGGVFLTVIALDNFNPKFIFSWAQNLFNYGSSAANLHDNYINNLSLSRSIWYVSNQLGIRNIDENTLLIFSLILSSIILSLTVCLRKRISTPDLMFILLAVGLLGFSKIVYHYYAVLFLVLELARVRKKSSSIFSDEINNSPVQLVIHLRKLLFVLLLLPIPIPILGYLLQVNIQATSLIIIPVLNPLLISISAFTIVFILIFESRQKV